MMTELTIDENTQPVCRKTPSTSLFLKRVIILKNVSLRGSIMKKSLLYPIISLILLGMVITAAGGTSLVFPRIIFKLEVENDAKTTTEVFTLNANALYQVQVIEHFFEEGSGTGPLEIFDENHNLIISMYIESSWRGTSYLVNEKDTEGWFKVPHTGRYYLTYDPTYYDPPQGIEIYERGIMGISSEVILGVGVLLLIMGLLSLVFIPKSTRGSLLFPSEALESVERIINISTISLVLNLAPILLITAIAILSIPEYFMALLLLGLNTIFYLEMGSIFLGFPILLGAIIGWFVITMAWNYIGRLLEWDKHEKRIATVLTVIFIFSLAFFAGCFGYYWRLLPRSPPVLDPFSLGAISPALGSLFSIWWSFGLMVLPLLIISKFIIHLYLKIREESDSFSKPSDQTTIA
ncbi:MAG: hypothetical protein ACFFC7_19945 [Candidatus Hermodarchaeota archaeon]